jgi:hypothetical protein
MAQKLEPPEEPAAYSPEGVDLTLIRWFLTLTPEERLEYVQDAANSIESMKELMTDA